MSGKKSKRNKFKAGRLVATRGVLESVPADELVYAMQRHLHGDWGEVSSADWDANDAALKKKGRLHSAYFAENGQKFWIITEADRSATTVLLPDEY